MVSQCSALRVSAGKRQPVDDALVVEEALQVSINGRLFSITMRTPGDDEALVKGLLFTEGVVNLHGLGEGIRFVEADGYTEARVDVPPVYLCENLLERRSLLSNAACGVCGKRDMDALRLDRPALEPGQRAAAGVIPSLAGEMRSRQASFLKTGGSHAAAAFTVEGEFLVQFEDVGRHNAVDKVIGQLIIGGVLARAGILMVSGRVSFEIVSKARAAGIRVLCAVSAPSSMAVEWAEKSGVALVAFCRDDRYTIYTHAEHLEF